MVNYELIICWSDGTWTTEFFNDISLEDHIEDGDFNRQVTTHYVEKYNKNKKDGDLDIAFINLYNFNWIEDEEQNS